MKGNLYHRLSRLRNRYLFWADVLLLCCAPALALDIRLDTILPAGELVPSLLLFAAVVVPIKLFIFERVGLYKLCWSYASSEELTTLLRAVGFAAAAELALSYLLLYPYGILPADFPRSIPILDSLFTAFLVGGQRLFVRLLFSALAKRMAFTGAPKNVVIAGAGVAGAMMVREIQTNPPLGYVPVGYLDDDPRKFGMSIHGVSVMGRLDDLPEVVRKTGASMVIVAMPTAPGRVVRDVIRACKTVGVEVKTLPGLFDLLRGSARVDQIRDIEIEDLLRRGAVKLDTAPVEAIVKGMRVMVTGAGGSIGAELCRQIRDLDPAELILLGHGENSIFTIAKELRARHGMRPTVRAVIADIRERRRMTYVFRRHRPQVIFHAAAHKHVGLMQENAIDAVTNNVLGTRILADLAGSEGVDRFVMISSDKAVNPTSTMGATKRVAELLVGRAAERNGCAFMTVRFGNVLGSRGSVVPIFQQQIAAGGPVTVTHPDARRFFMTIPEAVQLVLQAAAIGKGGEVFVLDMGEQVRIADIARDLIRLSGLHEGEDIQIEYTGLIPGEKMEEEIFYAEEHVERTAYEKIMVARNGVGEYFSGPRDAFQPHEDPLHIAIDTLIEAAKQGSPDLVQNTLRRIVPQYRLPEGMPATSAAPAEPAAAGAAVKTAV